MTITDENTKPRKVYELLEAYDENGYAGMTDEEVDSIIEWRTECALNREEYKARLEIMREGERQRNEMAERVFQEAEEKRLRGLERRAQYTRIIFNEEVTENDQD